MCSIMYIVYVQSDYSDILMMIIYFRRVCTTSIFYGEPRVNLIKVKQVPDQPGQVRFQKGSGISLNQAALMRLLTHARVVHRDFQRLLDLEGAGNVLPPLELLQPWPLESGSKTTAAVGKLQNQPASQNRIKPSTSSSSATDVKQQQQTSSEPEEWDFTPPTGVLPGPEVPQLLPAAQPRPDTPIPVDGKSEDVQPPTASKSDGDDA